MTRHGVRHQMRRLREGRHGADHVQVLNASRAVQSLATLRQAYLHVKEPCILTRFLTSRALETHDTAFCWHKDSSINQSRTRGNVPHYTHGQFELCEWRATNGEPSLAHISACQLQKNRKTDWYRRLVRRCPRSVRKHAGTSFVSRAQ